MSVSVNPPKTPVTKGSTSIAAATIPNVCKMPGPPAPFVPAPLPNIGKSGMSPKDYSQDVTIEGKAVAIKGSTFESMGDMASKATGGGLISANTHGITKFVGPGSMDVKIEGKNVQFLADPMLNNCAAGGSPPNAATVLGVVHLSGDVTYVTGKETCPLCEKEHPDVTLAESEASKAGAETLLANVKASTAKNKSSTMLGVVHCDHKYFAAMSGLMKGFVRDAVPAGWITPAVHFKATPDRLWEMVRGAKGITAAAWEKVLTKAEWYQARSDEDLTAPGANPPGQCAGTRVVVLALDCDAVPKSLTEIWYDPENQPMARAMLHWQQTGPGRYRYVSTRHFEVGSHVPPCRTCCVVLPALLCNAKRECGAHAPRTKN